MSEIGTGPEKRVKFRVENLRANGKPIASILREIMRLAGSEVNLPGWDSVRKHLSGRGKWWTNPCRGGNQSGDFTQVYVESQPGMFKERMEAFCRLRPGLMDTAMQNWLDAWAQGTLDSLAALPPVAPPGAEKRRRKRTRKSALSSGNKRGLSKVNQVQNKHSKCDSTSSPADQLTRKFKAADPDPRRSQLHVG